jgi:hypothetical protein
MNAKIINIFFDLTHNPRLNIKLKSERRGVC